MTSAALACLKNLFVFQSSQATAASCGCSSTCCVGRGLASTMTGASDKSPAFAFASATLASARARKRVFVTLRAALNASDRMSAAVPVSSSFLAEFESG